MWLTNEDLEMMMNAQEFLNGKDHPELSRKFNDFVEKVTQGKNKANARSNKYNKTHATYHNISNKLYYARKTNNKAKIELYTRQLEELKNNK